MENIVNMTKCVKGSTVHFRCGGDAFVKTTDPKDFRGFRLSFLHDGVDFDLFYHMEGQCVGGTHMTFLDIIRIDPPAFDV